MTRLRSCQSCARHVFATEAICPFCLTELAPAPELAQIAIPSGASRAQRLALAAALGGTSLLGCVQTNPGGQLPIGVAGSAAAAGGLAPEPGPAPGQPAAGRGGAPVSTPVYGAPLAGNQAPGPQAGGSAQPAAGRGGIAVPVYGLPIAGQAAPDDDAGVADAGTGGTGGTGGAAGSGGNVAVPIYGAPIPEYGSPPPPKD